VNARVPYYWAIDDHTEATLTPRVYSRVNPLLGFSGARQFHTGRVEVEGSVTYGSIFDNDGDAFTDASLFDDPDSAPVGQDLRGHIFAKGLFRPTNFFTYGFGFQYTSDDNFLRRYDLNDQRQTQGLYEGESARNTSQASQDLIIHAEQRLWIIVRLGLRLAVSRLNLSPIFVLIITKLKLMTMIYLMLTQTLSTEPLAKSAQIFAIRLLN